MPAPFPLSALRITALHAQSLTTPNGHEAPPAPGAIEALARQLTCVQIDTLHMVHRAQYVTLWSRLGAYDPADLDRLAYHPTDRLLFEYWAHAASFVPMEEYRYSLPAMIRAREQPTPRTEAWLSSPTNRAMVDHVLERITSEGGLRAADFEHESDERGPWWDWKPAKSALEYLFDCGILMIADRVSFQRVYDLAERVLPGWVDRTMPTQAEAHRRGVELAVKALGVCRPAQAAEYAYLKRGTAAPVVRQLVRDGVLVEVQGILHDGATADLIAHRDTLPVLEQAASGALAARRTTFLNPFDSLFWARGRDLDLWGFRQVLEAYKVEKDRIWGYYCLPILHDDRLVGRFDPRLDRRTGTLHLRALYLEPGIEPADDLAASVAAAMRNFLTFHQARTVDIAQSSPAAFGEKLLRHL